MSAKQDEIKKQLAQATVDACQECIANCHSGKVLTHVKALFGKLDNTGDMWWMGIHCSMVGITPHNRKRAGVDSCKVSELVTDFNVSGWDPDEVRSVLVTVEHDDSEEIHRYNMEEVSKSGNKLAPVHPGTLKYVTYWGNHANQAVRMWHFHMPHQDESLCSDGCLDPEKLKGKDDKYYSAIQSGYQRRVINGKFLDV